MLRIRLNEAPVKAKLNGQTSDIVLDQDEGLGEETAFLYHLATDLLLMQRNRSGVSASALAKYLKVLCKARDVTFECVLKPDALERITHMQTIQTFEIQFAGVQNGQNLKNKGHSAKAMYQMLDEFQAPNATIKLSAGKKQNTLQNVANAVTQLFGNQAEGAPKEVRRVIVVGNDGNDDERAIVDLFQDRLSEFVQVEVKDGERISNAQRFKALTTAWERNQAYLESTYKNPGE